MSLASFGREVSTASFCLPFFSFFSGKSVILFFEVTSSSKNIILRREKEHCAVIICAYFM